MNQFIKLRKEELLHCYYWKVYYKIVMEREYKLSIL